MRELRLGWPQVLRCCVLSAPHALTRELLGF